ncbi:hypothetical protein [Nocardioides alkalitolerans]|uniref:hypothetical protein n=1 Tax=Nocardioides alkalitolerans TaxID=281714 RepID=UPI00041742B4|nr:hypothetical protein [Nocardioides alkalitolerans]
MTDDQSAAEAAAFRRRLSDAYREARRTAVRDRHGRIADDGTWTRNEAGDVYGYRAFVRHMAQVGEEDQSAPDDDLGA